MAKIHTDIRTNTHRFIHRTKITEKIDIGVRVEDVPSTLGLQHGASLMENHLGSCPTPGLAQS